MAATRLSAELLATDDPANVRAAMRRTLALGLGLGAAAAALLFTGAGLAADWWLEDARAALSLRILAPSLPFMAVSGIGETAAKALADECRIRPFETIEELKSRTRISNSNIESLKAMGVLEGMPETDQLSMF